MVSTRSRRQEVPSTGQEVAEARPTRTPESRKSSRLAVKRASTSTSTSTAISKPRKSTRKTASSASAAGTATLAVAVPVGRVRRRAASKGVQRAVAALIGAPNGDVDELDQVIKDEGPDDDLETYQPEETVRSKRAKRKAEKLAAGDDAPAAATPANKMKKRGNSGSQASGVAEKKKPTYRVPALVERVFFEAGSVILRQLVALIGGDQPSSIDDSHMVESIKQSKRLLEMELVAPDAFAEVFGGRADFLRMKRPELYKLAQKAGFKGLSSATLDKMRSDPGVKMLAYLSIENCRLWRDAEEDELRASFESGMLPDEPTWLEEVMNTNNDVCQVYRKTLEGSLRLPHDITTSMPCMRSYLTINVGWRRSFDQLVYCYRGSVAIRAATLWREFTRMPELDLGKIVSERDDLRRSLNAEKDAREKALERAAALRKKWGKVGADLDAVLADPSSSKAWPCTFSYLRMGGEDSATKSVEAVQTMTKYPNIVHDEASAVRVHGKISRYTELSTAFKQAGLEVPSELDPLSVLDQEHLNRARQLLDVSWGYIGGASKSTLPETVQAYKAWIQYKDVPTVSNETDALNCEAQHSRHTKLSTAFKQAGLEVPSELDPLSVLDQEHLNRARQLLDVSWGYIGGASKSTPPKTVQAYKAWIQYKDVPTVSNETGALNCEAKHRRLELVIKAWKEHNLEDVELLGVNMPASKYLVTKRFIDGDSRVSLEDALDARLRMRDEKLGEESMDYELIVEQLPRHPQGNHVYVCPCGYYAGMSKMKNHLEKNRGIGRHASLVLKRR
jgi:hypothetical protein